MVGDKSLTVRLSNELYEYIDDQGKGNLTRGIERIIKDHLEKKIEADLEAGLSFLMRFVKAIEFRDNIEL